MQTEETLVRVGLRPGEAKVYLVLLRRGQLKAGEIGKETMLHRTTVYDFLAMLQQKGLATSIVTNKVRRYAAAPPVRLLDMLREQEATIEAALPGLQALFTREQDQLMVENYQGVAGFRTVLHDILSVKCEFCCIGVEEERYSEGLLVHLRQYAREAKRIGIKERLLTKKSAKLLFRRSNTTYRFMPDEYFSPTPSFMYGDRIGFIVWEPFTTILIRNSGLAESHARHFEMLWKHSTKTTPGRVRFVSL